ncbi:MULTISPECIES: phage tail protein [unclassified Tatumella]|uniref:phage tail protein n=1 Tax=unclassified Tatumella TaxID=2649542 RepID=UPI001BAE71B1|nr:MULTISPECIES: phage tail protein [unclassified Tatumella]MBS0878593.1 phage tail protein [Tatumella sp. JGM82]MBS0892090.1 phage tail protein [Tatumella sp. JGM94]MBS0900869.1 phage tail protein [Tatumella sp. JGM100]
MTTDIFDYSVSIGASGTQPVNTYSAQFGDGYRQVAGTGLNNPLETWDLICKGRPNQMIDVRNFLSSHCVHSFYWTNPWGEKKLYRVKADSIAPSFTYGDWVEISFTFEEAVAP